MIVIVLHAGKMLAETVRVCTLFLRLAPHTFLRRLPRSLLLR